MPTSWAVVATVDEPTPLVAAFVAHHLNEGAQAVHLFLDKPDPETVRVLRGIKGCVLTRCNKAYWEAQNNGTHPYLHTRRQIINANVAYAACAADWLLHCDADEFVRDGAALGDALQAAPETCDYLRLRVAERVMPSGFDQKQLFDGIFRTPISGHKAAFARAYHPVEAYLDRGLTGHTIGKSVARTGRGLRLGLHKPDDTLQRQVVETTRLLHFDGLTEFHFLLKLLRRAHEKALPGVPRHNAGRLAQMMAIRDNVDDMELFLALVEALKTLRPDQEAQLTALGVIDKTPFTPNLGNLALDLSVATFDAALRVKLAKFLSQIGFQG